MKRQHVNKKASARAFNRDTYTTKAANMRSAPMRGGIRM